MGVTRSFAGPLRISDLLAIEAAEGRIPSTEELIDIAIGWSQPMLLTRPELFSFFERSLAPALERAGRGQAFIEVVKQVLERLPEKLYRPVTDIALPLSFRSKVSSYFDVPRDYAKEALKDLLRWRGIALRESTGQPFLVGLNPKLMTPVTPVHEMMHYYATPEAIPLGVRQALENAYRKLTYNQLRLLERETGMSLHDPYELMAELAGQVLAAPSALEKWRWLKYIKYLPSEYQNWLRDILTELGENIEL